MGVECPTCGKSTFAAKGPMRIHHKLAHGQSIAGETVDCDLCGASFTMDTGHANAHERHFCSDECQNEWLAEYKSGENNPNYSEKQNLICDQCDEEYQTNPSIAKRGSRFCSRECYGNWQSENVRGESHPRWEESAELTCEWCNDTFLTWPSKADNTRFCSQACTIKWRSEALSGEDNPNWSDYVTKECQHCGEKYQVKPSEAENSRFCSNSCHGKWRTGQDHPNWKGGNTWYQAIRRQLSRESWNSIRDRTLSDQCRACGGTDGLLLHHIVPVLAGGTNDDWNLMTLCHHCHHTVEARTREFTDTLLLESHPGPVEAAAD